MRFLRTSFGFIALGTAIGAAASCSRTEAAPGVLMLSVQTDMSAGTGKTIQAVGLYVRDLDRGRRLFELTEPVAPDGTVKFPATLAIVGRNNPGAAVRIRVVGFRDGKAEVMRDAVTTIPTDRVALLALPLRWVNYEKSTGAMPQLGSVGPASVHALADDDDPLHDPFLVLNYTECRGETTTVDGSCVDWKIDSSKLPDFVETEVFGGGLPDGGGGKCFDVEPCFVDSTPVPLDATCLVPKPAGELTLGVKQGLGEEGACVGDGCYIPLDPESDEGWKTEGANVRITAGTCKRMLDGKLSLVVTTKCGSKANGAPLCGEASVVGKGTDLPSSDADGGGVDAARDGGPVFDGSVDAGLPSNLTTGDRPTQLVVDNTSVYFVNRGCKVSKADKLTLNGTATLFGTQLTGAVATDVGCKIAMTPQADALVLGKIGGGQLELFAVPTGTAMPKPSMGADLLGAITINQTVLAYLTPGGALRGCTINTCINGASGMTSVTGGVFLTLDPQGQGAYVAANQTAPSGRIMKTPFFVNGAGPQPLVNTTAPLGPVSIDTSTNVVYWTVQGAATNGGGIYATPTSNDGTTAPLKIIANENMQAASNTEPHDFVIIGVSPKAFIFWTNGNGDVRGAPLSQNATPSTLASNQNALGIAADANDVYWTDPTGNMVRKIARPKELK